MIHFVTRQATGSGYCRCKEIAEHLGYSWGFIRDPIPDGTKILVVVQRKLPEKIPGDCMVVMDMIDHLDGHYNLADAIIAPSEHAKKIIKKDYKGMVFIITNHHMNRDNLVVDRSDDLLGTLGYIGPVKWMKPPEFYYPMLFQTDVQSREDIDRAVPAMLDGVDIFWNFRNSNIDTDFKTGAKAKNSASYGIPSINPMEPATIEFMSDGCIICNHADAHEHYLELVGSKSYYREVRAKGIEKAKAYHISVIAEKYRQMFKEMLK